MRTFVMMMILCAMTVAWGAEERLAPKASPFSVYDLKIDSLTNLWNPQWIDDLRLAAPLMSLTEDFSVLFEKRAEVAALFSSKPEKTGMKMNKLGSVANTGHMNDAPSDEVYMPAESEENAESANVLNARAEAKKKNDRAKMMRTVANTDQMGDAPSDEQYQGSTTTTGSTSNVGSAVQRATEDAKKENARSNIMGSVTNGGQWEDNGGLDYQTNIMPTKKNVSAGEDRVPYLIKQLPGQQNPNKNPANIQRDIRREMMRQQVVQPDPYGDPTKQ